jgi:hypothetical protein
MGCVWASPRINCGLGLEVPTGLKIQSFALGLALTLDWVHTLERWQSGRLRPT